MKAQDCIVKTPFAPNKPHGDMVMLGYKFLCAHISIDRLVEDDTELATDQHEVFAVETYEGVNFYAKERA